MIHFYCLAVEAGFYSDVVECLPLDPAAQVRIPPRAVGIFLHPVTLLPDFTILVWKLKKNNAKYRQIDFLSFTFKSEVRCSSEMLVITKWTNQVLFCLGYLVQKKIKCIQQFLHKLLMNFKSLKNLILKICFSQNFKCLVFFEVD